MLVVMALGGNALLRRGEPLEAEVRRRNLLAAVAKAVAPIARSSRVASDRGHKFMLNVMARLGCSDLTS